MRKSLTGLMILLGSVSIGLAHHPFSGEFDANKPVTLTGTVTSVEWNAPHTYIHMDATDASGKAVSWKLEGATSSTLEQHGWARTMVKKGDRITAMAYRALDGSNTGSARSITLANGRTMAISDAAEDGGPQPEGVALPSTASNAPLIGLIGLVSIAAAFSLRKLRTN